MFLACSKNGDFKMDKRTFAIAMAIEIPVAFVVLSLLLNGRSNITFYIAWAIFALVVSLLFVFIKKEKDETKKEKLRRKIALSMLISIIGGAVIVVGVVLFFVIAYSLGAGF